MATPVGAEAVGQVAELWLIVCFEDGTHGFLHQFILPNRDAERPAPAIFLGNIYPPNRRPLGTLTAELLGEAVDFFHRHPIGGFFRDALCGRPGSFVDSAIGPEKQVGVVEVPVNLLSGQPPATFVLDALQYRFSDLHDRTPRLGLRPGKDSVGRPRHTIIIPTADIRESGSSKLVKVRARCLYESILL